MYNEGVDGLGYANIDRLVRWGSAVRDGAAHFDARAIIRPGDIR